MKKTADTFYMTQNEQKKLPFTVPVIFLSVYIFGSAIRSIILRNYITAFVFMVFSTLIIKKVITILMMTIMKIMKNKRSLR